MNRTFIHSDAAMSRDYHSYVVVAFAFVVLYYVVSVVRQYLRLRHIKGPPSTGFSKWWLIRTVYGGRAHLDFYEASEKYGTSLCHFSHACTDRSMDVGWLRVDPSKDP